MRILFLLILMIALVTDCTSISEEGVSAEEQIPTVIVRATPSLIPFLYPNLPPACGTIKLGKPGTQTKEGNHSVLVEGTAILCNHGSLFEDFPDVVIPLREAMIDLDSGSSNIELADIGFGVYGTMNFYGINEINSALASIWSLNGLTGENPPQPTFEQCKELDNSYNNDNEPEYVCVITNEGHIARVKVENYNPVEQVSSIEISFVTWEEKVEKP